MELRQLEQFVAVAEERHFTRAAARVHVGQSGLSAAIAALEHELGDALFVRDNRQVTLTAAGQALLPAARRALAAAQDGRDAVAGGRGRKVDRAEGLDRADVQPAVQHAADSRSPLDAGAGRRLPRRVRGARRRVAILPPPSRRGIRWRAPPRSGSTIRCCAIGTSSPTGWIPGWRARSPRRARRRAWLGGWSPR
nr:LysR family transcriptional regulator [Catenulispora rubra]